MCNNESIGDSLNRIFADKFKVPPQVWHDFSKKLRKKTYSKNEIIKHPGSREKHLQVIWNGSAGIFVMKNDKPICLDLCYEGYFFGDDKPICLDLCYEGYFFGDYASFLKQEASHIYTQALEKTTLLSIEFSDLQKLYKVSQYGYQISRISTELLFIHKQNQLIDLKVLSAEERYKKLLRTQPNIIKRLLKKSLPPI